MSKQTPLVLYIEDDGLLINLYQDLFTIHGWDFVGVRDFESSLEYLHKNKPDIVLLDLILPSKVGWDHSDQDIYQGLKILQFLKENPDTKDMPIVILSNVDDSATIEGAKRRGADDYIIKAEVLPEKVFTRVKEILEKYKKF